MSINPIAFSLDGTNSGSFLINRNLETRANSFPLFCRLISRDREDTNWCQRIYHRVLSSSIINEEQIKSQQVIKKIVKLAKQSSDLVQKPGMEENSLLGIYDIYTKTIKNLETTTAESMGYDKLVSVHRLVEQELSETMSRSFFSQMAAIEARYTLKQTLEAKESLLSLLVKFPSFINELAKKYPFLNEEELKNLCYEALTHIEGVVPNILTVLEACYRELDCIKYIEPSIHDFKKKFCDFIDLIIQQDNPQIWQEIDLVEVEEIKLGDFLSSHDLGSLRKLNQYLLRLKEIDFQKPQLKKQMSEIVTELSVLHDKAENKIKITFGEIRDFLKTNAVDKDFHEFFRKYIWFFETYLQKTDSIEACEPRLLLIKTHKIVEETQKLETFKRRLCTDLDFYCLELKKCCERNGLLNDLIASLNLHIEDQERAWRYKVKQIRKIKKQNEIELYRNALSLVYFKEEADRLKEDQLKLRMECVQNNTIKISDLQAQIQQTSDKIQVLNQKLFFLAQEYDRKCEEHRLETKNELDEIDLKTYEIPQKDFCKISEYRNSLSSLGKKIQEAYDIKSSIEQLHTQQTEISFSLKRFDSIIADVIKQFASINYVNYDQTNGRLTLISESFFTVERKQKLEEAFIRLHNAREQSKIENTILLIKDIIKIIEEKDIELLVTTVNLKQRTQAAFNRCTPLCHRLKEEVENLERQRVNEGKFVIEYR